MDVGCSLQGFGGPINRQNNKKIHKKCILASKTRKKTQKNMFPTRQETATHFHIIYIQYVLAP